MDLRDVIKKQTLLPPATNAKFYRLKGLSQAERDRKMNERIVKTPKNLKLLESDDNIKETGDIKETDINKVSPSFDRHGISASIKEVNGGLDLSNTHWEKYYAKHLEDIKKSNIKKSHESFLHKDIEINSGDQPEIESSKHQLMKESNKIFRNAAIMGLIKTNKISLEDLADSNNKNCTKEENGLKILDTQNDNEYQVQFVSLHEDSEVFVHPLQMGIDRKKFTDIDFTVPRVGKKIKETPQEYFLRTTDDDSFQFVKKNKSTV